MGFPCAASGKESVCQCRRHRFAGLGQFPGERNGNPLQYFLPGKFHGQRSLADYHPWGCRLRHHWVCTYHVCIDLSNGLKVTRGKLEATLDPTLGFYGKNTGCTFFLILNLFIYLFFIFFKFYFIFKLYIIVLVLPNIKMNLP